MRLVDLALKDLLQVLRDRRSLLFLLVMPIVFTAVMGYAFGQNTTGDPRLVVGWRDADGGALAMRLRELLAASAAVRLVDLETADDSADEVGSGRLAAVVLVPEGFTTAALAGHPARVNVVADQAASGGQAAYEAIRAEYVRALSAAQASRASLAALDIVEPPHTLAEQQAVLDQALAGAVLAWQAPPLAIERVPARAATTADSLPSGFAQSSPGMIVMFAVFGLTTSSTLLVAERKSRTLQRLVTTNMSRAEIIGGHALAMAILVLGQQAILVTAGQLLFDVNFAREPLGLLLVMAALALWVVCLGLLVGVLAREEQQVIMISLIAMFVFSALGGAWFPLEVTGETFARIGHVFPSAWAMDGFQNLLVRELGAASVLGPAAIMLIYAAAFLALAVWRFRTE
jgi:ABC-2 type transport system permease protein